MEFCVGGGFCLFVWLFFSFGFLFVFGFVALFVKAVFTSIGFIKAAIRPFAMYKNDTSGNAGVSVFLR